LPLGTDAFNSTAQLFHVQQYLRKAGIDTILGPPLNIGITYEGGDGTRAVDPKYPGNMSEEFCKPTLELRRRPDEPSSWSCLARLSVAAGPAARSSGLKDLAGGTLTRGRR
jgi:hypothetical protein